MKRKPARACQEGVGGRPRLHDQHVLPRREAVAVRGVGEERRDVGVTFQRPNLGCGRIAITARTGSATRSQSRGSRPAARRDDRGGREREVEREPRGDQVVEERQAADDRPRAGADSVACDVHAGAERRDEPDHEHGDEEAAGGRGPASHEEQHDDREQRQAEVGALLRAVAGEVLCELRHGMPAREREPGRNDDVQQIGDVPARRFTEWARKPLSA
jgi:hypothetical protein